MNLKSLTIKTFASRIRRITDKRALQAHQLQHKQFEYLLKKGAKTDFGKDFHFDGVMNYEDFKQAVPIVDYEGLRAYVDRVTSGKPDVLWPGKPQYLAKTSGTTSGAKYIPISRESVSHHVSSARNALLYYGDKYSDFSFLSGRLIFLSGSPELSRTGGIATGRLSGIVNHQVPSWLKRSQLPSDSTNRIEDWEHKLDRIVEETIHQNMTLISGIPPWVKMYYERLLDVSGKESILELFPQLSMFVYGGVNYEPYRQGMEKLLGGHIPSVETYPASEGFIAYQTDQDSESLLLNMDNGVYYEFVRREDIHSEQPQRVNLEQIELGVDYVLIINSTSGLWGYNLGDIVRFTSRLPYQLIVVGRVKHFISAFGEHVIGEEVDKAMKVAAEMLGIEVNDFTVAPFVSGDQGSSYHEWYVELGSSSAVSSEEVAYRLDDSLIEQNIYYRDLREGHILACAKVHLLPKGAFREYMKQEGKLGGQNKVPRLANDRLIADKMMRLLGEQSK